jgi:hypothetical protein
VDPIVGLFVAGVLVAVILYRRRPFIPNVPRQWRSSHSVAAGLCRRLHRAVDNADRAVKRAHDHGVAVTSLDSAVSDLRSCAAAIDQRLVLASELPLSARHRTLLVLRYRISDVEKAAHRVAVMAADAETPDLDHVHDLVDGVHLRLDDLERARRELREYGGTQ